MYSEQDAARRAAGWRLADALWFAVTSIAAPPAPLPAAVVWIDGDFEMLLDVLLRDHGFEERSMMVSDGISVPDGLFVQRDGRGLLVWVPPDPQRTGMDPVVLPRAVRIEAAASSGGTRLTLHRVTAPATAIAITTAVVLTGLASTLAFVIGGAWMWGLVGVLGLMVWGSLAHQFRVSAARTQLAWDALQPALHQVGVPEPALPDGDPYR